MDKITPSTSQLLIHQTHDGQTRPAIQLEGETIWLNHKPMACLGGNT